VSEGWAEARRYTADARCLVIILCEPCNMSIFTRDAMLSMVYTVVVCLSVSLSVCACVCMISVTLRYCIKTAKRRITQIMPHDRPGTLVLKWDVL